MEKVSFIIPVYKINEEYLRECVTSVLKQSYKNIEVILIDDGSPDNCGKICDEYAAKDDRVTSIHQENAGVSVARNNGISRATGDYVAFVDSDDWVEENYAEKIVSAFNDKPGDIVLFGYSSEYGKTSDVHLIGKDIVYRGEEIDFLRKGILNPIGDCLENIPASPWAKVFTREFIKNKNLLYVPGLKRMQDNVFCFDAYGKAENVKYVNTVVYHWRANENSVCYKYNPQIINISEKVLAEFRNRIDKIGNADYEEMYNCKVINILFGEYMRSYFRHESNTKTRKSKIKEFDDLCTKNDLYKNAIREVKTGYLGKKYALMTKWARKREFGMIWFMLDVKDLVDKVRMKNKLAYK